uniref:EGF-like domain-containing protein n=1 Tax=Trichuris muris TaxID=70415 RepID=A0A5S6QL45_TRIMR
MSCDKSSCVHGICVMIDGQGRCNCTHGYTGEYCDVPIQCKDGFCLNGGTCFEMLGRVECKCPSGFSGLNCERKTLEQTSAKGSPYEDKYLGIAASIFIFSFISGLAILAFVKYLQQRSQVRSKAPHELSANRADSPEQAEEYDVRPMSRDSLVGVQNFLLSRNMDARRSSAEAEDDWFKRRISAENPIARYAET